jgi:hypothetical protein
VLLKRADSLACTFASDRADLISRKGEGLRRALCTIVNVSMWVSPKAFKQTVCLGVRRLYVDSAAVIQLREAKAEYGQPSVRYGHG